MFRRKVQLVRQLGNTDCGVACIVMILNYYEVKINSSDITSKYKIGRNGMSLHTMKDILENFGFIFKAYKETQNKEDIISNLPLIICSHDNHFAVVSNYKKEKFKILDPVDGVRVVDYDYIKEKYHDLIIVPRPSDNVKTHNKTIKSQYKLEYSKAKIIILITLTLVSQSLIVLPAIAIKHIVNSITSGNGAYNYLYMLIISMVIGGSFFLIDWLKKRMILIFQNEIYLENITSIINKIFNIDLSFFENHTSGDLENRFNSVNEVYEFISVVLTSSIVEIVTSITCGIVMTFQSLKLFLILVLLSIIQLIFVQVLSKKSREYTNEYVSERITLNGELIEILYNIQQIRYMRIDKLINNNLLEGYKRVIKRLKNRTKVSDLMGTIVSSLNIITSLLIYSIGGQMVVNNELNLGTLISFVTLSSYFIGPFRSVSLIVPQFHMLKETIIRLEELMSYSDVKEEGDVSVTSLESLELRDVSFEYLESNKIDINGISLKIKKGDRVAIVGESGSGKTTLTKLILNAISNYTGMITINDINITEIRRQDLDELFAVVTQTPMIRNGTIRENIDIFNNLPDEQFLESLQLAELSGDIDAFPLKANTYVGENGQNISGGQKQRLAIARALASKSQILVLDEATSNIDPITESKIFSNIKNRNITQIIITHRLSAIKDVDCIYVMEDGKILEKGTHSELIDKKGTYYKSSLT